MDTSALSGFTADVWWRGFKRLSVKRADDGVVEFSNGDTIKLDGQKAFLNGTLIWDMPGLDSESLLDTYLWRLKKKGYKFLD